MSYWIRASQIPETIAVYERAAEARYLEGCELIRQGYRGGGMYLLGYVAEILLKTVFFRGREYDLNEVITTADRKKAGITKGHDALEWAKRIIASRVDMDPELKDELLIYTKIVSDNWNESLRYRDTTPTDEELEEFTESVIWIEMNRRKLSIGRSVC